MKLFSNSVTLNDDPCYSNYKDNLNKILFFSRKDAKAQRGEGKTLPYGREVLPGLRSITDMESGQWRAKEGMMESINTFPLPTFH